MRYRQTETVRETQRETDKQKLRYRQTERERDAEREGGERERYRQTKREREREREKNVKFSVSFLHFGVTFVIISPDFFGLFVKKKKFDAKTRKERKKQPGPIEGILKSKFLT